MIFDSHAHYDDEAFDIDRDEVLKNVRESGIGYVVNAGSDIKSSRAAAELASKYDFVYGAVGVHPEDAVQFNVDSVDILKELAGNRKIVAVGEIGLDYYYEGYDRDVQRKAFEEQIRLALDLNLPVIVHDREAHGDTFDLIKEYAKKGLRGVIHCYSGSPQMALQYTDMGFFIGFTGVITFKNAVKSIEVLKSVPIDRVLIETDCPYLAPVPMRGKRNDSTNLKYVIDKACEVLNLDREYFTEKTCENAIKVFQI